MMKYQKTGLDELSYRVNGLAMQVQHELRSGHRERVYQQRLHDLLVANDIKVEMEKRVDVMVNGATIGLLYIDLWIADALVVECKGHTGGLTKEDISQVITYLAATGAPVGLLYNFWGSRLEIKRVLPPKSVQDWHKHLYRFVWTPPGQSLPALDTLTPQSIYFSVVSQSSSAPPAADRPTELTTPPSAAALSPNTQPSAPVRLSEAGQRSVVHSTYASAGVSIEAGNRAVALMRDAVRSTYGPEVLAGIGAFGGLFDARALKAMDSPVLVASTDGVGTKVKLAAQLNRFDTIGEDLVNHCINDILVQGARPLFFLDYVAASTLDPEMIAAVVGGLARACRAAGCALLGGETAEMPGVYQAGEFDVAGTLVGVVERQRIFPRPGLAAGDVLIGLASSGPHTNGYSLIRKIVADLDLSQPLAGTTTSLADALLAPHRQYLTTAGPLLAQPATPVKALAHLTGGGFIDNLPRVLPEELGVDIDPHGWPVPPVFTFLQARGAVDPAEMYRVFNMGIGLVLIVAADRVVEAQAALPIDNYIIGRVTNRHPGVHIM